LIGNHPKQRRPDTQSDSCLPAALAIFSAATRNGRSYILIDQNPEAIAVMQERLPVVGG
jgi:hypothetical protein